MGLRGLSKVVTCHPSSGSYQVLREENLEKIFRFELFLSWPPALLGASFMAGDPGVSSSDRSPRRRSARQAASSALKVPEPVNETQQLTRSRARANNERDARASSPARRARLEIDAVKLPTPTGRVVMRIVEENTRTTVTMVSESSAAASENERVAVATGTPAGARLP